VAADMMHVPYKGAGPVMIDLVGGQVDLHFASLPAALPLMETASCGRWRQRRRRASRPCPTCRP